MSVRILIGDCRAVLAGLPSGSVQTCVTSPPYFGLRDYGADGQIGLEATPEAFVAEMVAVFREVRRVLRDDGTLWLNLGDTYASAPGQGTRGGPPSATSTLEGNGHAGGGPKLATLPRVGKSGNKGHPAADHSARPAAPGLKPKDLIGIPWRVAFALQADGWWLRQEIVWAKPNPMPESVTDRCTKAHEQIFLLTKSGDTLIWRARDTREWSRAPDLTERVPAPTEDDPDATAARWRGMDYYFDGDAIAEGLAESSVARLAQNVEAQVGSPRVPGMTNGAMKAVGGSRKNSFARAGKLSPGEHGQKPQFREDREPVAYEGSRNKRSVWTVATTPFKHAHFATYPPALIEPCILAGAPPGGVVLDPFGGAGTTGLVAARLGREAVLIELNPEYAAMAQRRIKREMHAASGADETVGLAPLPLFAEAAE